MNDAHHARRLRQRALLLFAFGAAAAEATPAQTSQTERVTTDGDVRATTDGDTRITTD